MIRKNNGRVEMVRKALEKAVKCNVCGKKYPELEIIAKSENEVKEIEKLCREVWKEKVWVYCVKEGKKIFVKIWPKRCETFYVISGNLICEDCLLEKHEQK